MAQMKLKTKLIERTCPCVDPNVESQWRDLQMCKWYAYQHPLPSDGRIRELGRLWTLYLRLVKSTCLLWCDTYKNRSARVVNLLHNVICLLNHKLTYIINLIFKIMSSRQTWSLWLDQYLLWILRHNSWVLNMPCCEPTKNLIPKSFGQENNLNEELKCTQNIEQSSYL